MQTIELASPRIVVIEDRGRSYALTVRPIPKRDWLAYFQGILSTSEYIDGKRIDSDDSTGARIELVEKNLIEASGYAGELPADWQKQIPLAHRLAVGNALISVEFASPAGDEALSLGIETIYLNAVWGAGDDGKMRKVLNLRHEFKTPTGAHQQRYSRDASRSRVVGGTRTGKTQWLGAQSTLIELYDELIVGVNGYTAKGDSLEDRGYLVEHMDTYHKVAAAARLFSPAAPSVSEEE